MHCQFVTLPVIMCSFQGSPVVWADHFQCRLVIGKSHPNRPASISMAEATSSKGLTLYKFYSTVYSDLNLNNCCGWSSSELTSFLDT